MSIVRRAVRFAVGSGLFSLSVFFTISPVAASPFDCAHARCGLLTHGTNPNLVVGTVEAVATPTQMKTVFHWAHQHGYWQSLPADGRDYLHFAQLISLAIPTTTGPRSVTVLMTRNEYDAGPLQRGAMVRYSPHDAAHDAITYPDPARQASWALVGCVAQLCAAGDTACNEHYQPGVFTRRRGIQLQIDTGQAVPGGLRINPQTLLPMIRGKRAM